MKFTLEAGGFNNDVIDVDDINDMEKNKINCIKSWLGGWTDFVPAGFATNPHFLIKRESGIKALDFVKFLKNSKPVSTAADSDGPAPKPDPDAATPPSDPKAHDYKCADEDGDGDYVCKDRKGGGDVANVSFPDESEDESETKSETKSKK